MRICAFGRSLPVHRMGGLEHHFQAITRGLARRGHQVTVITTKHPRGIVYEKKNGLEIHYLPGTISGRYGGGYWRKSIKTFNQLLKKHKYDLILSESAGAYGCVREKIRVHLDVPIVFIAHGTSLGDIRTKLKQGVPSPKTLLGAMLKLWGYRRDKHYFPYIDMILSVSPFVTKSLRDQYLIESNKLRTLPNSVDPDVFSSDEEKRIKMRRQLKLADEDKAIFTGGRLERQKGIHLAIEAMPAILEQIPGAKLAIIGGGTYENRLKRLAAKLDLSGSVMFLGSVPNPELAAYYNAADVYLMPSLGYEGLPTMLLEAMASGVPVLASKSGGIHDVLENGTNGLLIEPQDVHSIVESVVRVLRDTGLAKKLVKNARSDVEERYSQEKMLDALEAISKEVIERKFA